MMIITLLFTYNSILQQRYDSIWMPPAVYRDVQWSSVAMTSKKRTSHENIMLAILRSYKAIWQWMLKSCIWCNQKVLSILKVLTKCASSSDPSIDWCKHLGVGIYALISWSKHIVLYGLTMKPVFTTKWVGALQPFWLVYVSDILLIRNDVEFFCKA